MKSGRKHDWIGPDFTNLTKSSIMRVKTSGFDDFIASQLEIFVNVIMGSKFCIFCINLYFDFLKNLSFMIFRIYKVLKKCP